MVRTWHQEGEHSSGAAKIFTALILFAQFFIATAAPDNQSGYFWQLTDVHWDQRYSRDGDPYNMCHQKTDGRDGDPARVFDPNGTSGNMTDQSIGQYGMYSCDAPWDLIELSIKGMAENSAGKSPDFIIWTGDNTPHVKDPSPDWSIVFSSLRNVSRTLRQHFPKTAIIPVLGNHDVYPEDFYPSEESNFYHAYLTEGIWDELLSQPARESFGKCGFYTMEIRSKLQVVVLNTNLYNAPDNLTRGKEDPCGQFSWLEQQFQLALAKDAKILLAAHIPPGFFERWIGPPFFNADQNDRYVQLIQRYGSVIMTHVYGHTHTDSFRIFGDSDSQVQSVAFVSPSVTPWLHEGGVNPSLRLYQYTNNGILDYWQYYLNLTRLMHQIPVQQRTNTNHTEWQLLYRATTAYDVQDLSAPNVLSIYKEMITDPAVFERYYFYNTVGHVFKECDAVCIRDHLCALSHVSTEDMNVCQAGHNVLFRNDPHLSDRFAQIARRAELSLRSPWPMVVYLIVTCVAFVAICSLLLVKFRRNASDGARARSNYHANRLRYQPFFSLDRSKYTSINSDEI